MATAQAHRTVSAETLVEEAARQLRDAVICRKHDNIESRIVVYCDAVRDHLDTLKAEDLTDVDTALTQALDLLEWTRLMLCASRAACAGRLERAAFAGRFLGPSTPRVPEIRFDL